MSSQRTPASQSGSRRLVRGLIGDSMHAVKAGGSRLIGFLLVFHVAALIIALPVLGWIFRQALHAAGMTGLDLSQLQLGRGITLTLALLVVLCAVAFWVISLQFSTVVLVMQHARAGAGITARGILSDLGTVAKKLARPSSFPFFLYLFLLLPLTGFGFLSVLSQGIAIPSFISGELLKSPASIVGLTVFILILMYANVRFALAVPTFTLTSATGGRALRTSWRLTRSRKTFSAIAAVLLLLVATSIASGVLLIVTVTPTVLTDLFAPAASPAVAAFSLGFAQVIGVLLSSLATAFLAGILLSFFERQSALLPETVTRTPLTAAEAPRSSTRNSTLVVTAGATVCALVLGAFAIGTMTQLAGKPDTLVLGHRGFTDGGVENTISGLDAAQAAGADMVEMDVMQSADGQFVAMHDSSLTRLAGRDDLVKDLTLDELTSITVHNLAGHEDTIPSFADYVSHADEIGMPLLIEIKLNGGETPDHVALLLDELDGLGLTESNIYHSLDPASVAELKRLRPDLSVGYTMAFAAVEAPDTPADFIVVEEWTATQKMQDAATAAGLGFWAWTVNDEAGMRELLRRNVDGIITDHPDLAVQYRDEMTESSGLASKLVDAFTRFVKIV